MYDFLKLSLCDCKAYEQISRAATYFSGNTRNFLDSYLKEKGGVGKRITICWNYLLKVTSDMKFPLKSWTIYQQLWLVLVLCKILRHFKSLTPSKLMPQESNHDFKEIYLYIQGGIFEPICIKDILTKNLFFALRQRLKMWVWYIMT